MLSANAQAAAQWLQQQAAQASSGVPARVVPAMMGGGQQAFGINRVMAPRTLGAAGASTGGQAASSSAFVVSCKGPEGEEVVIKTLVGEYQESGNNHGRKVFKKQPNTQPGAPNVDVYMYYWDGRDGPAFQGWWFGNQVGGTQVWSHSSSESLQPPGTGWKIPWDGQVRENISVTPKQEHMRNAVQGAVQGALASVHEAVTSTQTAIEEAKVLYGDMQDLDSLKEAEAKLLPKLALMNETIRKLMEGQKSAGPGEGAKALLQMGVQVRAIQTQLNTEVQKIRQGKIKAEQLGKQREAEAKDFAMLQEVLPEATQKTNLAEDCVEKCVITSEMIAAAGEDMEAVKSAVQEVEQAAQEAQKSIGEARIFLNAKQAAMRRFDSEKVREQARDELLKLQNQLQEAQKKLNPLKTVRQDYQNRATARKVVEEVLAKLTPAELDVDRAEEASMMLDTTDAPPKEMLQDAEKALNKATESVNTALKYIEQKKPNLTGELALNELQKVEERARGSLQKLTQMKNKQREAAENLMCESIIKDASEKIEAVAEAVGKAADAEGPFLMGVEELPIEETMAVVKACESASTSANTAVSIARMFIATKLVEAKRFSKGPSELAQNKLKELQQQLEVHAKRLGEVKANTQSRKKKAFLLESESEVSKAEKLAKEVSEAAAVFEDEPRLSALSSAEMREAADKTMKAESAANRALAEARKFITARQIEARGKTDASGSSGSEAGAELVKLQTRLSAAQTEVGKFKKLAASVEERLAAKKVVEEASSKLEGAEEKVKAFVAMVQGLDSSDQPEEASADKEKAQDDKKKEIEAAAQEAAAALKSVGRFFENQTRSSGAAKNEVQKLQPRVDKAQEELDAAQKLVKDIAEKKQVAQNLDESEKRVKDAETAVQKLSEAELAFLPTDEAGVDMPADEAAKALSGLEEAVSGANSSVGGAKTFLAMKRLWAKRLGDGAAKAAVTETLTTLQARLDACAKTLADTKKKTAERKVSTVKREVVASVKDVEKKVEEAEESTKSLDGTAEMAQDAMRQACQKAGSAHGEAQTAIEAARTLCLARQRDAKASQANTSQADANSQLVKDIADLLEKLQVMQTSVDRQKGALRDVEHKFVAQRLMKDASEQVEKLEKKLESTTTTASPLASDNLDAFTSVIFLQHILDMIRQHATKEGKTAKEVFEELSEKKSSISEEQFKSQVGKLLEKEENKDLFFSDEQQAAAFKKLLKGESSEVSESDFFEQYRSRYVVTTLVSMTDSLVVKGGKTIRKLEANEIVEALSEPVKDDAIGILRIKAKSEKDEKEGYITVSGNQGTVYLEPYSSNVALQKQIEKVLQELADDSKECLKYIDQKSSELKSVRTGPLAETKTELQNMRPRIEKVQAAHHEMKKKVASSGKRLAETMEVEKKKRQEAKDKKMAESTMAEVKTAIDNLNTEVDKVVPPAEALAKSAGAGVENPTKAMDQATDDLQAVLVTIEKTITMIKGKLESVKGSVKGPLGDMRANLVKQKVQVAGVDSKCKKHLAALKTARKQLADDSHVAVVAAIREHCSKTGLTADALFTKMSKGTSEAPLAEVKSFLSSLEDVKLTPEQLDLGLQRYSSGLAKTSLMEMLQEYHKCVKEIAVTTAIEVKASKTIRKIAVGEIVEVLERSQTDAATGMVRAKCRALSDAAEGFVTLRGNQGTCYLEKGSKPYYQCVEEVSLVSALEAGEAKEVRKLKQGEVVEMLEGPRKDKPETVERMRGKAKKDGKVGWVTLEKGKLEQTKVLVCKNGVALTTSFDIAEGKSIRKLEVGETLEALGEEQVDEKRGLSRIKTKAGEDEGWITLKGNQGTAYAEPNDKLYVCRESVQLDARLSSDSALVRMLEVGELFEVTDGPKNETREGVSRIRCRSLSDGAEGWILVSRATALWSPHYRCRAATALGDVIESESANSLRNLESGETLFALTTPVLEAASGLWRLQVRTDKDGQVGFATAKDKEGKIFLEPAVGDGGSRADESRESRESKTGRR